MAGTEDSGSRSLAYSAGRLSIAVAVLAVIWYLVAEFLIWGDARALGGQPPLWAWLAFLAAAITTLISGLIGIAGGIAARNRSTLARTGLLLGIAGPALLIAFFLVVTTMIEG